MTFEPRAALPVLLGGTHPPSARRPDAMPYRWRVATYRVMSWRDIPAQVQASDGSGTTVNVQLPTYFQQEIDRIAMREGLIDSDEYLDAWAWSEPAEREGSAQAVADAVAAELVEAWERSRQARSET